LYLFVLNGKKKIGYIYLPAFYSEWDEASGFGCANDIAKEILKLKRENIEGIILDLRNNSGGSLMEAQSLAGIFIDEGPLFIQGYRDEKMLLIKDSSRGIIYDGPLIIMLNKYSASTSEFVAAALRDYNRALLVGSRTYGKASSQITLPVVKDLENMDLSEVRTKTNMDFIQLTTNLYYHLSGDTHQLCGVSPDVPLPGYLENVIITEKNFSYALVPDKIEKKVNYRKAGEIPVALLAGKSAQRVARDSNFQKIKDLDRRLQNYFAKTIELPLDFEGFIKGMKEKFKLLEEFDETIRRVSALYTVENSEYNLEIIQMNPFQKEMNDEQVKYITEDIYIQETYRIMEDLIRAIR
jgi:carboxyl-terminal processing protease